MAELTKTAKATAARARAREMAAAFREREDLLEELAVAYFTSADEVERVLAVRDREVEQAERKATQGVEAARSSGDDAVLAMLDQGVSRGEVVSRLGCTSADVRRALDARATVPGEEHSDGANEDTAYASDEGAAA